MKRRIGHIARGERTVAVAVGGHIEDGVFGKFDCDALGAAGTEIANIACAGDIVAQIGDPAFTLRG